MNADEWKRVETLFHTASEMTPETRKTFLAQACSGDATLRQHIESLLGSFEQAGSFLEQSPFAKTIPPSSTNHSSLVGQKLGHYEIASLLGVGGMGEVYLAKDLTLHRQVALKILPAQFTADAEQVQRFEREARAASALNHPNIITVHEIGHDAGLHFIATEHVAGETLRQKITRSKLELREAVPIATQIVEALATAHAAGLIHRDIKPENVMVRPDGLVKVLDFGLAKPIDNESAKTHAPLSISLSLQTDPSLLMGTLAYLSPEQARRERLDHRTDLFSFGIVLFEMLTGARPFHGEHAAALLNAIEHDEPSADFPPNVQRVLNRALAKDRTQRYSSATELSEDLRQLTHSLEMPPPSVVKPQHKPALAWVAVLAGILLFSGLAYWLIVQRRPNKANASPWLGAEGLQLTQQPGEELFPSLAPDGQAVVYASRAAGNWDIYWQTVDGKKMRNLTSACADLDSQPAFSPDGEWIAFRSNCDGGGIFVIRPDGNELRRVTDFGYHPAWSPDGKKLLCTEESIVSPSDRNLVPHKLWVVEVATGNRQLFSTDDIVQPQWSPHGHRLAYWGQNVSTQRDIWTRPADGGAPSPVTNDAALDWNPVWSPDGRYLYFASNRSGQMALWRVAIDEISGKVLSAPEPASAPATFEQQLMSFSRDGRRLAYVAVARTKRNLQRIGFDPATGRVTAPPVPITRDDEWLTTPALSPDDQWLVCGSAGETQEDLFLLRSDGTGQRRKLTNDAAQDRKPSWSPDGKQIAFYSNQSGLWEIWLINADGTNRRQITFTGQENAYVPFWSPDGMHLVYTTRRGHPFMFDPARLWWEQTPQPIVLPGTQDTFLPAAWSPDGTQLAGPWKQGENKTSSRLSAYSLQTHRLTPLTNGRGLYPVWLNDNRRVLFVHQEGLFLSDPKTLNPRPVFSVAPHHIISFALTRDNRSVYLSVEENDTNLRLLTLQ